MNEAHFTITVFISLLLIASSVAMATKWIRIPYTLTLVIVGIIISPMQFLPQVHISPDLILLIFLPALLFEAAWNMKIDRLRENLLPIVAFATVGVADRNRPARTDREARRRACRVARSCTDREGRPKPGLAGGLALAPRFAGCDLLKMMVHKSKEESA